MRKTKESLFDIMNSKIVVRGSTLGSNTSLLLVSSVLQTQNEHTILIFRTKRCTEAIILFTVAG